jgi:hypothetical protein
VLAKQARTMVDAGCQCVYVVDSAGALIMEQTADRVAALVAEIRAADRVVVIAAAPVKDAAHALAFSRAVDGVVLVARTDRTHRDDVEFASESIRLIGGSIIGVIAAQKPGFLDRARGPRQRGRTRPTAQPVDLAPRAAIAALDGDGPGGSSTGPRRPRRTTGESPEPTIGSLPTS